MSFRTARSQMGGALAEADERLTKRLGIAPSPVHAATVNVLSELMSMGLGLSNGSTPVYLKTLMRSLQAAKPMMLENVSQMPPDRIKAFMADLIARMQTIVDTPDIADITEGLTDGASPGDPRGHVAEGA